MNRIASVAAILTLLLATACKDDQRYYSYETEPGPMLETDAPAMPPAAMPTEATGPAPSLQPDPDRARLGEDTPREPAVVAGVVLRVPADWQALGSTSAMRAAEFRVPPVDGERGAEFVVFYFGPGQGGSAMENISRWVGQVEIEPGTEPRVMQHRSGEFTLSEVIVTGTLKPSTMGVGPTAPQPDSALHGIVIEGGPEGSLFIRLSGHRETVLASDPAVASLLDELSIATP